MKRLLPTLLILGLAAQGAGSTALAWTFDQGVVAAKVREHVTAQARQASPEREESDSVIDVEVLRVPGGPLEFSDALTPADVRITLASGLGTMFTNRTIVRARLSAPNGEAREIGVPVKITITRPVWVVKEQVSAGQALSLTQFRLENRDISQQVGLTLGAGQNLAEYQARVNLRPGETLDIRKITRPPAVKRNADVSILLSNGQGMDITVQGLALEDGRIGQTIRVRNSLNRAKCYSAKVIDRNRVLVEI